MILALIPLLLVSASSQQSVPSHPLNGLLNGNFEHLHPGTTVDGGFWVGGEGRTLTELAGSNRFLRIPTGSSKFVYQRVGVAPDRTYTATLGARVRVTQIGDEARLTLSEGDRSHDSLAWTFANGALCGLNQWGFFEELSPGVPTPMAARVCSPDILPVVSAHGTSNQYSWNELYVSPSAPFLVTWTAPEAGTVRIIARPWRATVPNPTVQHEILFDTNDPAHPPTSIRIDQLAGNDVDGPVILERCDVVAGNRIVFKLSQPAGSQSAARVMWYPTISYEGRRLTYRFGNLLSSANAPANPYVNKTVTIGAWTSFPALNAAADFAAAYGAPPKGPLDVELSGRKNNLNRVDFDDVQCVTKADDVSEASMREMILAEARWARDNWRRVRDRVSAGGTWTLGAGESPYWVHQMRVVSGPQQRSCGPFVGLAPPGLWELLDRAYDDQDYEDFFWMREQEVQNLSPSPIDLPYSAYDCCSDQYLIGGTSYPSGVGGSFDADLYQRTNDPTILDRGFAGAKLLATHGVIGGSGGPDPEPPAAGPRDGLIWAGNYDIDTGAVLNLFHPVTGARISPSLTNWGQLGPPTTILRTYVACKQFNAAHPWIVPPRYPTVMLDQMLAAAQTAVVKAIDFKWWASPGMHHTWGGLWHAILGSFNDNFGYMSRDAWPAYEDLASLSNPTPDEISTRTLLRDEILISGCDNFLPLWEQASSRNDMNASDSPRAWPSYLSMIGVLDLDPLHPNPNRDRYANQLVNAAFACVNFQYRGGIWTMAGQDPFQLINLSGGFGGGKRAVEQFFLGMSTALAVPSPNLSAARRVDLMTEMSEMQRINEAHYKATYGYYDRVDYPPGHDNFAGAEWRTIVSLLTAFDTLDEVLPDAPSATVLSPTNLRPEPPMGQTVVFRFQIHVPTATSTADLQSALEDRTRIDLWAYPGGGAMAVQNRLWTEDPASHALFSAPVYDTVAKTATLAYLAPIGANAGKFKFTIRTWDPDGQWDRDTSYQEWELP